MHINFIGIAEETRFMSEYLEPHHCVSNNLHQTARAVTRIYSEEMRPSGIKRSQFAILATLDRMGPMRLTELADLLYMERTTLTRNLKPLEKTALVEVKSPPDDARARVVSITEAGKEKFREARKCWKRAQKRLLDTFGVKAWQQLEDTLRQLRTNVPILE